MITTFLLRDTTIAALAWTLIHFLWQGALIGAVVVAIWRAFSLSAATRYLVGVAALGLMLAAPVATFVAVIRAGQPLDAGGAARAFAAADEPFAPRAPLAPEAAPSVLQTIGARVPALLVSLWLAGVGLLSMRLAGGWFVAQRIARRVLQPVSADVQVLARRVAARLAIDRVVRVFESVDVAVPVLIGWLNPVVILPTSVLAGLPASQLEALLAHELAHVRRHDYLVNLLQSVTETLLFYHPAVWWVSRQVRVEREHCCDDMAVSVCDRLDYVTALTNLAAMRVLPLPAVALGATDGPLLSRVKRLLGHPSEERPMKFRASGAWLGALVAVMIPVALVGLRLQPQPKPAPAPAPAAASQVGAAVRQAASPTAESAESTAVGVGRVAVRTSIVQKTANDDLAFLRAQLQDFEQEIANLRRQRAEIERTREAEIAVLEEKQVKDEMERLKATAARVQRLVEVGQAGQPQYQEALAAVADAEQRLLRVTIEARKRTEAGALDAREEDLKDRYTRIQQKYREAQSMMEQGRLEPAMEFIPAALRPHLRDPLAVANRRDTVEIRISNEPQLPSDYRVQDDGTIRLPLLGVVVVGGQTLGQIQERVTAMLKERRLAPGATVSVSLTRDGAR